VSGHPPERALAEGLRIGDGVERVRVRGWIGWGGNPGYGELLLDLGVELKQLALEPRLARIRLVRSGPQHLALELQRADLARLPLQLVHKHLRRKRRR
jgi:hypothetical protein